MISIFRKIDRSLSKEEFRDMVAGREVLITIIRVGGITYHIVGKARIVKP